MVLTYSGTNERPQSGLIRLGWREPTLDNFLVLVALAFAVRSRTRRLLAQPYSLDLSKENYPHRIGQVRTVQRNRPNRERFSAELRPRGEFGGAVVTDKSPRSPGLSRDLLGFRRNLEHRRMAVRAVWCEPVSGPDSLLNRENTGKFSDFGHYFAVRYPLTRGNHCIIYKIPCELKEGKISS